MSAFDISATGLTAQRVRMDVIANNIANAQTLVTREGGPYRRRTVVFETIGRHFNEALTSAHRRLAQIVGGGVKVSRVIEDRTPSAFQKVYDPSHPFADSTGIVLRPNINVVQEMVDMIDASRGYEANVTALNSTKQILSKALEIGRA
jgi:flagellar basal-body rod protein FlgC